jgi:hypothetical protein
VHLGKEDEVNYKPASCERFQELFLLGKITFILKGDFAPRTGLSKKVETLSSVKTLHLGSFEVAAFIAV